MYNIFYFARHLLCFSRLSSRLTREHLNFRICICDPLQVHPIRQHTVLLIHRHTPEKTSGRQVDFKPTWLQSQEILHFEERCLCDIDDYVSLPFRHTGALVLFTSFMMVTQIYISIPIISLCFSPHNSKTDVEKLTNEMNGLVNDPMQLLK